MERTFDFVVIPQLGVLPEFLLQVLLSGLANLCEPGLPQSYYAIVFVLAVNVIEGLFFHRRKPIEYIWQ